MTVQCLLLPIFYRRDSEQEVGLRQRTVYWHRLLISFTRMFTLDHAPDTFCPDGVGGETRLESQDYETVQNSSRSNCNDVFFSFIYFTRFLSRIHIYTQHHRHSGTHANSLSASIIPCHCVSNFTILTSIHAFENVLVNQTSRVNKILKLLFCCRLFLSS